MSGTLIIQPAQAQLLNENNALANITPFWIIILGDQAYEGKVCKFKGPTPQWDDSLTLKVQGEPALYFEIKDSSIQTDDILGVCEVPLDEAYAKKKTSQTFSLYHNQREVGQVTVNIVFNPDNTQSQSQSQSQQLTQTQTQPQTQPLSQSQPQSTQQTGQSTQQTQSFGQTELKQPTQEEKETKAFYGQPYGVQQPGYPTQQYQGGFPQQTQVSYGQQQVGGGFVQQQQTYPQQQTFPQQTYPQQTGGFVQTNTYPQQQQVGFQQGFQQQSFPQQTYPQQQTFHQQTFPQQTGFVQTNTYPQQQQVGFQPTYTQPQQTFVSGGTTGFVQTSGYGYPQQQVYMTGTPINSGMVYTNPHLPTYKPYGGAMHFPGGIKIKHGKVKVKKFGRKGSSSSDSD